MGIGVAREYGARRRNEEILMGPWSKPTNVRPQVATAAPTLGPAEWALIISLAALVVLGAVAVWCSRYEIGFAVGVPTRLDRFTGQVIGCAPGQGCVELVPAGEPPLRSVHRPAAPAGGTGDSQATPAAAAQPAPSAPAAPAKPKG
jgi:hypothetical protein